MPPPAANPVLFLFSSMILAAGLVPQNGAGRAREGALDLDRAERAAVRAWRGYLEKRAAYRRESLPISRELGRVFRDYRTARNAGADITGLQRWLDGLRRRSAAVRREHQPDMDEALRAFHERFLDSDWRAYDVHRHRELLQEGLLHAGRDAIREDPDRAVRALQTFLEKFSGARAARSVNSIHLPNALVAAGRAGEAREHVRRLLQTRLDARLYVTLGDLAALEGRFEEAATHWQQAGEGNRLARLRLELVNKPAPGIEVVRWIGGKSRPLTAADGEGRGPGQVLVVSFWASWCGSCRAVMPGMSRLHREHSGSGLGVVGVTRCYDRGYLPADGDDLCSGGELVEDLTEETYPAHLEAFKKNTGIGYPFAIVGEKDFTRYGITNIPTVVVVDASGRVVFVGVGGACEPMVRAAALRALERALGTARDDRSGDRPR